MDDKTYSLEALKLIADWAKWLITIETAAIAAVGAGVKRASGHHLTLIKVLSTAAIASFVVSIAAAALLLLSLPEIAQNVSPETNIWMTRDNIIGRVFGMNTQSFALVESFFFGVGVVLVAFRIIIQIWSPNFGS